VGVMIESSSPFDMVSDHTARPDPRLGTLKSFARMQQSLASTEGKCALPANHGKQANPLFREAERIWSQIAEFLGLDPWHTYC
jgi:hypothetical protein